MIQRTALITGGATRLGAEIASFLVEQGCAVLIHYHSSSEKALALRNHLRKKRSRVDIIQADLADPESFAQIAQFVEERFWRLDFLINNAARFERAALENIRPEAAEQMWKINTQASLFLTQACRSLLEGSHGSVVNIIDNCSGHRPWAYHSHYAASKAGTLAITRSLAAELAPEIRVNAVGPGAILCEENDPLLKTGLIQKIPMQRWGTPQEIAETVWFLLSGPRYITGELITVDGGWSLR